MLLELSDRKKWDLGTASIPCAPRGWMPPLVPPSIADLAQGAQQ